MNYARQWISGDEFLLFFLPGDGSEISVPQDDPAWLAWLAAGGVPEDRPYTPPPPAAVPSSSRYAWQFTDAEGAYTVLCIYGDGREQPVSMDHGLYLDWLAAGNTPEERPYVPPAPPELEILRALVVERIAANRDATLLGGFTVMGMRVASDPFSRELLVGGRRMAEDSADPTTFTSMVWLADGNVVQLTGVQLIGLSQAMDQWAKAVYEASVADVGTALSAERTALEAYLEEGTWP